MRTVRVFYREEADGAWIATCPEVPGYVGYGDTYEEARERVEDGLPWFAESDLLLAHVVSKRESHDGPPDQTTRAPRVSFAITRQVKPAYSGGFADSHISGRSA